ncbi:MAG: prepilin peptidase [Proteocatella sp.]
MRINLYIIFSIILGLSIPSISYKIIEYKCSKLNLEVPKVFSKAIYIYIGLIMSFLGFIVGVLGLKINISILALVLIGISLSITLIDIKLNIIPNEMVLTMFFLGIIYRFFLGGLSSIINSFVGAVIMTLFFGISMIIFGTSKLGAGDIKLATVSGFIASFEYLPTLLFMMALSIAIVCSIGLLIKKLKRTDMIPFAGFIIFGMDIALLQGLIFL